MIQITQIKRGGYMKKIVFLIVTLLFAFNAEGTELKIGYVDFNKALNESDAGKKAAKILEDIVNSKRAVITKKEEELNKLKEEMEKQSSVLTPESKKNKEEQFNKLYKEYQRTAKDFQEEIQNKEKELINEIQKDLLEIVNKISEEENYTVVFTAESAIIYFEKKLDITEKVIKKYDEITKTKK